MAYRRRLNAAERAQSEALANAVRDRRLAALAPCTCGHAERGFHVDTRTQLDEMAPGAGELHVAVHVVPAERGKHVCDSCARKALERSLRTGEDRA